jgi:hypothetical protein
MPLIGLNLGLFGANLFTGSPKPYLACHVLGYGGKFGVIDQSMCKRPVPASETGKRLVLRVSRGGGSARFCSHISAEPM